MTFKLSEEVEQFYYEYDKSKPLLNQVIHTYNNIHLINVRKTYTNGIYFGVYWTVLITGDNSTLAHNFQCKDRGYTEEIVDSWESFSSLKNLSSRMSMTSRIKARNPVAVNQNIDLPLIGDRKLDVIFVFNEDSGYYDYTHLQDDNGIFRGLYGAPDEKKYKKFISQFGVAIAPGKLPTLDQVNYLWKQANISLSNIYTYVNTEYSKIKLFKRESIT